ncbi:MAG: hypothetical protein GTN69_03410 [Armatimonadetes bacterium]|nr:hypothetical protein [Armatimonadota bacterium]
MNDDKLDAQLLADLREEAEGDVEGYIEVAAANLLWILNQLNDTQQQRDEAEHNAWRMLVEYLTHEAEVFEDTARGGLDSERKQRTAKILRWQADQIERKNHKYRANVNRQWARDRERSQVVAFLRMCEDVEHRYAELSRSAADVARAEQRDAAANGLGKLAASIAAGEHTCMRPWSRRYRMIYLDGQAIGAVANEVADRIADGTVFELGDDEVRMVYVDPRCPECKEVLDDAGVCPEHGKQS